MNDQFLWSEKYRPQTIDDCVMPEYLKKTFKGFIKKGQIQHMILSGSAGVGKTTAAQALAAELGWDCIVINGSKDNGIDVLRTKLTAYATSVSMNGAPKMVIIDEADGLTQKVQEGLRNFLEEYAQNCRFIFTCNYANKIIEPIHSRCGGAIEFKIPKEEKPLMASQFLKRVIGILEQESVEADRKVVAQVVTKHYPDFRKTLNALQKYSVANDVIDEGILHMMPEANIKDLLVSLKEKNFTKMRQWVANNADNDIERIYSTLFDALIGAVNEVPQAVLIVDDYNYKAYFVADKSINLTACFTELMASVTFK